MTITFDSSQHELFLGHLDVATAAIQAELDDLDTAVGALQGTWSGAARDAYAAAQSEWTESMTALRDLLTRSRDGAARAGERLRAADEGVRSLWGA